MACGECVDGQPTGDCRDVLHDVWLFLDDELDPQRRAVIQQHLDDCSPCLTEAGIDRKLKQLLAAKCGGDEAPDHLRDRITVQLRQWKSAASG